MQLNQEFIRIPLDFDAQALRAEVEAFGEEAWRPHPEGHRGNWALPLVAVDGDPQNDGVKGRMQPTPALVRSPYLRQVLAALDAPIGRTRLMRIDGNSEATEHVDVNYYWQQRMRVHVPVITDPAVIFSCGARTLHMAPGECWIFDTWRRHNVTNPNPTRRIHLVADTVGSPSFAQKPRTFIPFDPARDAQPRIEVHNLPLVMMPGEMEALFAILEPELHATEAARALRRDAIAFIEEWRELFRTYGESAGGWQRYAELLERTGRRLALHEGAFRLANGTDALFAFRQFILGVALNTDLAPDRRSDGRAARNRFDRPVFIVSSPRSGSSLLYETLAQSPDFFSIGGESHAVIEGIEALHPRAHGWESNRLVAADATDRVAEDLAQRFAGAAVDRERRPAPKRFRFLEKTPKNSLRVPFLKAIFPDAFFIYLYRDERATMSSMLEAWRSGRFVTYPELPGWDGPPWSLLLVPEWRELRGKPLAEIVARQWETATRLLLDDLEALPSDSWCVASYDHLIAEPREEILRLCKFVGVRWDRELTIPLPQSRHTLTPPDAEKWRANAGALEPWQPLAAATATRARDLFARSPLQRAAPPPPPPTAAAPAAHPPESEGQAFRSVHTNNLPQILRELRASLLVSTYQSGRVVVIRADGPQLNTHFRMFPSAMGIAVGPGRLAIGTLREVWDYRNVPAAAARLHPAKHDACFLPRNMHVTGDIRIHEIAFDANEELWVVNTRFSALCTLDSATSFVPRWRPRFVTHLAAEDRCHLNGLCMEAGRPRFVTALGATNEHDGWREKKSSGGVLIDVPTNEIAISGLSMPHSPRLHDGKLWLLESAKGTLLRIDPSSGNAETVAELPGFTRGLAFAGPLAFIGLSQVRESVFENIPLGQRLKPEERSCGIWIVDTRNGRTVGFIRFEGDVQEIFDVQLLPGIVYPELLEVSEDLVGASFVLSDEALAEVAG